MATTRSRSRALLLVALLASLVAGASLAMAPDARAGHEPGGPGTVAPEEDDPEGCTTATAETEEGCGAQGRDHFANAGHQPPVEACADRTTAAGGRITRILADGPRRADGTPAFRTGACVYLPPGYDAGDLRYPTMYLLHGGGGDQADWVTFGSVEEILDRAYGADPDHAMVAVMPDGRSGQWYDYEDGSYLFETYVLEHLVPYVDDHFRTIADRRGRVIAGLSNGGYGSLHLAAKRPDLFVAAGAMSSNLGARGFSGLGDTGAVHYQGSVPYQLATNYDEVDLVVDLGTSCRSDVTVDLCATLAVDLAFLPDHIAFANQMEAVDHRGTFDYRETEGSHAWRWWTKWLEERDLPFFHERLLAPRPARDAVAPSEPPEAFRYRSIATTFEVWDHTIEVERSAREFLDLRHVAADRIEVQGSGQVTLTTAARYRPGRVFAVEGATDEPQEVVAARDGRLTITFDLGPSHTHDQFTPEADLAEAAGGYWTTRDATIADTGRRSAPPAPHRAGAAPPTVPGRSAAGERAPGLGGQAATTGPAGLGTPSADGGAAETAELPAEAAAGPRLVADQRGPQLVPTVLFVLVLAAGPALWWFRRRSVEVPA